MRTKLLFIALLAGVYSYTQNISQVQQVAILTGGNSGYNDIILNAWPVYTVQSVNININSSIPDKGFISIYDLNGRLVTQEFIVIKNGENNYVIEIENINGGEYMAKISSASLNLSKKIYLQ